MRHGETVQPEALLQHLADLGLSRYDMPEYLLVLDALPLTSSGKVTKRELARGVEEGRYAPIPVRYQRRVA
jgi:acyl-CoA synthetase